MLAAIWMMMKKMWTGEMMIKLEEYGFSYLASRGFLSDVERYIISVNTYDLSHLFNTCVGKHSYSCLSFRIYSVYTHVDVYVCQICGHWSYRPAF